MFDSHFPLKSAFCYFIGNCASLSPDVSMLPGHTMICLHLSFCIMWQIACLGALLMYSVYPLKWSRNQFLDNKGGGAYGSLHISIYGFTLGKSFTLFKPWHLKKPVSHQKWNSGLRALFISICHGVLYWIMEFERILFHGSGVIFEL